MNILIKSSGGIALAPIEARLICERKVFIEGEIKADTACDFVKSIMLLNKEDDKRMIDVLINSPGGEINSGMLMYDAVQTSRAPVRMYCIGRAYSMAAIIFASGNYGRYMLPNSELMIHEPILENFNRVNSSYVKTISENMLATKNKLNSILAKHTGKSREDIDKAVSFDHYFTADESIEFGLCDSIVGIGNIMEGFSYDG